MGSGFGYQLLQLPIEGSLGRVRPAEVESGVSFYFRPYHVVHLAPVFKFPIVFPFQFRTGLLRRKLQPNQLLLRHTGYHLLFYGLSDLYLLPIDPQHRATAGCQECNK